MAYYSPCHSERRRAEAIAKAGQVEESAFPPPPSITKSSTECLPTVARRAWVGLRTVLFLRLLPNIFFVVCIIFAPKRITSSYQSRIWTRRNPAVSPRRESSCCRGGVEPALSLSNGSPPARRRQGPTGRRPAAQSSPVAPATGFPKASLLEGQTACPAEGRSAVIDRRYKGLS